MSMVGGAPAQNPLQQQYLTIVQMDMSDNGRIDGSPLAQIPQGPVMGGGGLMNPMFQQGGIPGQVPVQAGFPVQGGFPMTGVPGVPMQAAVPLTGMPGYLMQPVNLYPQPQLPNNPMLPPMGGGIQQGPQGLLQMVMQLLQMMLSLLMSQQLPATDPTTIVYEENPAAPLRTAAAEAANDEEAADAPAAEEDVPAEQANASGPANQGAPQPVVQTPTESAVKYAEGVAQAATETDSPQSPDKKENAV